VKPRALRASSDPDFARIAALVGDPVRAAMLSALLDGRQLAASELAFRSGSSAQAASAHLSKLRNGGLVAVSAAGRQRLFRLASADVAHAIEALQAIAPPVRIRALEQDVTMRRLRDARSCYDHLAGRLGVAVTDSLVTRRSLQSVDGSFDLTARGESFFRELAIDVASVREQRRSFARACMDWTERRPHLAGALGAALLERLLQARWLERNARDRSLRVTPQGRIELARLFAVGLA
jgi:DNA-binding transcriptional ArsR family regulator